MFMKVKLRSILQPKTMNWVCISSIEFITVCSLVLMTSCNLNPRFLWRLHDSFVLQSIITYNAKLLRKNLLLGCFICLSTNSYLCFLYAGSYLFVMAGTFLWPKLVICFICFYANINHFIHTNKKTKIFDCAKCSVIFGYFLLNLVFKFTRFLIS